MASVRFRQEEGESPGQLSHVTSVTVPGLVPAVMVQLQLGRQTRDFPAEDVPLPESPGWVRAIRSIG